MKHVSILVPQGDLILSTVVGTYKIFNAANIYLENNGKKAKFKLHLVGIEKETTLYDGLFSIHPNALLNEIQKTDLIIIPAIQPNSLSLNLEFIPWINEQYKQGAEVASLCVGSFLLACTGLLKDNECSTHWIAADAFKKQFPHIKLVTDKIVTDKNGIYTSGGAYSFLNLILYLVEKNCGRDVSLYLSKLFEIDINRNSQAPFILFNGQKDHEDETIKKAQIYMESNLGEKISVEHLANLFAVSKRNFERRFKKATTNTPVEYLQRIKIESAKKSLEKGRENINEIMYSLGYSDSKSFRTTFKKITGLSPLEYKKKYNRELLN